MEALMKWIPRTAAVPKDRMDMNKPIHAHGIDSLTAAGLRNWELGFAAAKKYKDKDKDKGKDEDEDKGKEKENREEEKEEKEKTKAGEDSENRVRST